MRAAIVAVVLALGLAAAIAVAASGQVTNGLPSYTKGYAKWPRLNAKPVTGGSAAHAGVKNTYASRKRAGKTFPNGTVIVKSIAERGAKGPPAQVAVMRKVMGRWRWAEYELSGSRYTPLGVPVSVCTGCHVGAKSTDWVFTKR
jgi:hypothetical protein